MTRLLALLVLLLPAPLLAATEVEKVVSDGGITAWLVPEPSIPMVAFDIHFGGGAATDPSDKAGATSLMTALLEEGAGDLDSVGFATRADELAVRFGFDPGRDGVSVTATMLTEYLDDSIGLLALAINDPTFPDDAIARVRPQLLSNIRSDATDPNRIARETFDRIAYPGHPYAMRLDGTEETVSALTRQDLVDAWRRSFARDRITVGVVGDITAEELGPVLDRLFGTLPEIGAALPPVAEPRTDGGTVIVDFDTPQSVAVFGHAGIDREDPDYLPAYVFNHILGGGGFGSRLTDEIRERRGLTYGIFTFLASSEYGALYLGSVASANDRIAEAVEVLRAEWERTDQGGVTAEELEKAKRYLTGNYPLRFDSNQSIAGVLVGMQLAGLPIDYIVERNDLIEALTLEEVNRVGSELLRPDNLTVVVVGRPEGLERAEAAE